MSSPLRTFDFKSGIRAGSVALCTAILISCAMNAGTDGRALQSGAELAAYGATGSSSLSERQKRILGAAQWILGRTDLVVDGQRFPYDCAGTVLAIYYKAGIDLLPYFNHVTGNGVVRLYRIAQSRNLVYTTQYPRVGDVIFWDNTYDSNGDGKWDDPLTHAGVVVNVRSDGTIAYIHQNYARGIVIEQMNLIYPAESARIEGGKTVVLNSPMRMRSQVYMNPNMVLAGQLYRDFGALYRIP
ncbi:MAG TPA: CHAP domain-containing protein [Spirochaetia bacterium]|nr:CHAP domain-containing protein [Spirochaetia bacterium]